MLGVSSVAEHLPRVLKVPGSTPNTGVGGSDGAGGGRGRRWLDLFVAFLLWAGMVAVVTERHSKF